MKFLFKRKDGGPESKVTGYWLIEAKNWFSIALLRFDAGSRDVFHSHAFTAYSWLLYGSLLEQCLDGTTVQYTPHIMPIITPKERTHKVFGLCNTNWVLSFRGPWDPTWKEVENDGTETTLAAGREVVK